MAFSSASVNSFPSGLETVPTQCVGMRADTLQATTMGSAKTKTRNRWLHAAPKCGTTHATVFDKEELQTPPASDNLRSSLHAVWWRARGSTSLQKGACRRSGYISFLHDCSTQAMMMGPTFYPTRVNPSLPFPRTQSKHPATLLRETSRVPSPLSTTIYHSHLTQEAKNTGIIFRGRY